MRLLKYEIFNEDGIKVDEVSSYAKALDYEENGMTIKTKMVEVENLENK